MSFPRLVRGRLTIAIVGSTIGWLLAVAALQPLSAQPVPPPAEALPPGTAPVGMAPTAGGMSSSTAASAPASPVAPAASQAPQMQLASPAASGVRASAVAVPPASAPTAVVPRPAATSHGGVRSASGTSVTKPLWRELSPVQQQALAPLSGKWDTLNEAQKRKWLALSRNFTRLAPPEQQKLHSRMTEWAALTQQQRAQARFNYGETRKLSVEDRKAKWEAYQALSADEKKKLATGAAKAPATAAAVRPTPGEKMAPLPRGKASQPNSAPPRIASQRVDQHTLLPQPAPTAPAHSVD